MKHLVTITLVFCSFIIYCQEDAHPKNAIGITLQHSEYDLGEQSTTLKLTISRYIKSKLELRLNSNLNFSDDFYSLNSHGIGVFAYGKFKEKTDRKLAFLNKLRPYMGSELEYNRRKYFFPFDGIGTNQVVQAHLDMGLRYDPLKFVSFFAETRALSVDLLSNNGYSGDQYFSKLLLFNGFTAGAKIRF